MPSIKQIENRLGNKCTSLNKVNLHMANAEKGKDKTVLRKLIREKATLDRDIRKLKRQLNAAAILSINYLLTTA